MMAQYAIDGISLYESDDIFSSGEWDDHSNEFFTVYFRDAAEDTQSIATIVEVKAGLSVTVAGGELSLDGQSILSVGDPLEKVMNLFSFSEASARTSRMIALNDIGLVIQLEAEDDVVCLIGLDAINWATGECRESFLKRTS